MARYIDADALIEVLQEWRDTSSLNDGAGNPVDSILYDVIRYIEDTPTADVAPRAEVNEAYWEGVEYGNKDGAALVAREIFEEIENEINNDLKNNKRVLPQIEISNALWNRVSGKINALQGVLDYIAKLKKKYTQPAPPKGD